MFIDNPTLPSQLEVLVEVLAELRERKADKDTLVSLINSDALKDNSDRGGRLIKHWSALTDLKIAEEDKDKNFRLKVSDLRKAGGAKSLILEAFDQVVLSSTDVEKWFSRFYSYLIVRDQDYGPDPSNAELFTKTFMRELPSSIDPSNPLNSTKYVQMVRWYLYAGMGWLDINRRLVPCPTDRIRRSLGVIFKSSKKNTLTSEDFMRNLGDVCPELDGGVIFSEMTDAQNHADAKRCTKALATALWELHEDEVVRLSCPHDHLGWDLSLGGEGRVPGESSSRMSQIELLETEGL